MEINDIDIATSQCGHVLIEREVTLSKIILVALPAKAPP